MKPEMPPSPHIQPIDEVQYESFLTAFRSLPLGVLLEESQRVAQKSYDLQAKQQILAEVIQERDKL